MYNDSDDEGPELDADSITKTGISGALGVYGLRLLWSWINRERQEKSLYNIEVEAHAKTREELEEERKLRKSTELELRMAKEAHSRDRESWFEERDKDRELREQLKDEVHALRREIKSLRQDMEQAELNKLARGQ